MSVRSAVPYVAMTLVVVLSLGGGLAGYVLGTRSGADLEQARRTGYEQGQREAAASLSTTQRRQAFQAGRREGYRRAYERSFGTTKAQVIASGPQACGDAAPNQAPVLIKVRAEEISCSEAFTFVRSTKQCRTYDGRCQGWSCQSLDIGWETSEVTCSSGGRRIRFITGV